MTRDNRQQTIDNAAAAIAERNALRVNNLVRHNNTNIALIQRLTATHPEVNCIGLVSVSDGLIYEIIISPRHTIHLDPVAILRMRKEVSLSLTDDERNRITLRTTSAPTIIAGL